MTRPFFLRPVSLVTVVAVPLLACSGSVVSRTTNRSDELQSIDPSNVRAAPGSCPAGYAHPNVCCHAAPGEVSECGAYVDQPFRPCDEGWSPYPNPLSCCSLTDHRCVDVEPGPTDRPPSPGCAATCPPGWWTPGPELPRPDAPPSGGSASGTCCHSQPDGSTECVGWATADGGAPYDAGESEDAGPGPSFDAGPPDPWDASPWDGGGPNADDDDAGRDGGSYDAGTHDGGHHHGGHHDAGAYDAGAPDSGGDASADGGAYDAGPDGHDAGPAEPPVECDAGAPPPPVCSAACPPGWENDSDLPGVCCHIDASGTRECFAQAPGDPGWPVPQDAGAPPPSYDAGPADPSLDAGPAGPFDAGAPAVPQ